MSGFENIATTVDPGYILLPRALGCVDYGLCYFGKHTEDFDVTLRKLNMPIFGVKAKDQCFLWENQIATLGSTAVNCINLSH